MPLNDEFEKILQTIRSNEASYARIAVIGQPGAGKSTLINKLIGKKVAKTGQGTDTTLDAMEYEYELQKIVELPGYGTALFRFDDWKERFRPQQYDLFLYVFGGKFSSEDDELFDSLRAWNAERRRPMFLVRNKSHDLDFSQWAAIERDIHNRLKTDERLYFVDCRYNEGLRDLHTAIMQTDFGRVWRDRIATAYRSAKAEYLENSRRQAKDEIGFYCKTAAVNGINPFLGVDVAVDLGIYFKMFGAIRDRYGIDHGDLKLYALPIAKKLLELVTKEGLMILLKNVAGKATARTVLKYIPFAGQAAAAALSYKMAEYAGDTYEADCYSFAGGVMDEMIERKVEELMSGGNIDEHD